jgi:hypothetical protein
MTERTMTDNLGNTVPVRYVSKIEKERDRVVRRLFTRARKLSKQLAEFRIECLDTIEQFLAWEACQVDGPTRGTKGNVTLPSFDGTMKVSRARQDSIDFDERLQMARQLIREYVNEKAEGIDHDLQLIIDDAFNGTGGRLNTARVLGLLKLKIQGAKWHQAMELIKDSIRVTATREYARFYERPGGTADQFQQLSLDIANA